MTCFVMQQVPSVHGHGSVTTSSFSTAAAGEVVLAFVSGDGPDAPGAQRFAVSGAGLTWRLVKRENGQPGDAEVWAATAATRLKDATVHSIPLRTGYDQNLTVIAMQGATRPGAAAAAAAAFGAPHVSLVTAAATNVVSLIFAVGNDYSHATTRTPVTGQVILDQWLATRTGETYWSEYTNTPVATGTKVTMRDSRPTADRWNFVAVELVGAAD
jgi:hypothetical protein